MQVNLYHVFIMSSEFENTIYFEEWDTIRGLQKHLCVFAHSLVLYHLSENTYELVNWKIKD